jgi:hypothetical protein
LENWDLLWIYRFKRPRSEEAQGAHDAKGPRQFHGARETHHGHVDVDPGNQTDRCDISSLPAGYVKIAIENGYL